MEFRILGPLQVVDGGQELPLSSPKEQKLLAALLLRAGEVVSRERLIDELWGELPPATADKALTVHVSQLRKTLTRNGGDPIATRTPGYALAVDPGALDAAQFARLVTDARARAADGDVATAAPLLREALGLWRGPALDGVDLEAAARNEARRLDEERLAAQMDRIDCELALGLHEQLIGELEALVAHHPLRERLRGQLMLALYRSGRQADALKCYRDAREALVDELGIEPSTPLQRLERAILNHEGSLDAPSGLAREAQPADGARKPLFRRRVVVAGALAAILALAVAATLIAVLSGGGGAPSVGRVVARIHVPMPGGPFVGQLAYGAGSLWVRKAGADEVLRVDPATNEIVSRIKVGFAYDMDIAVRGNDVWVTNGEDGTVSRIDAATNRVVATIPVGAYPIALVPTSDAVWVANHRSGSISRIDPRRNRVVKTIALPDRGFSYGPMSLAYAGGSLWAEQPITDSRAQIWRIDPQRNKPVSAVATVHVCGSLTSVGNSVWHANCSERTVTQIDARTAIARTTHVPCRNWAEGTIPAFGSMWAVTFCGLLRIDPTTGRLLGKVPVRSIIGGIAGGGSLWLVNQATRNIVRVELLLK